MSSINLYNCNMRFCVFLFVFCLLSCNQSKETSLSNTLTEGNTILSVSEIINAFNDLDDFKNTITEKFDVDTILYDVETQLDGYIYTIYSINNEGVSGILVADEAISIMTEDQMYMDYYDNFYNYLNEHCIVTMRLDENYCTYDDWECENIFWNIKVYSESRGGTFYIRNKNID